MNWEKDTDARRRRRCIDDRRRDIISIPVTVRLINTPAMHIAAAVMPTSSVFVTAVVMSSVIFAEGRHYVHTADHCCQNKPHHNLASYGPEFPDA